MAWRHLRYMFRPFLLLVRCMCQARNRIVHRCFEEWRELGDLKLLLYSKVRVQTVALRRRKFLEGRSLKQAAS